MPRDPQIKRIVQKQIGQHWRHDTSLWCAFVALQDLSLRGLQRRSQPAFHVEQDPGLLIVLAQSPHQEAMIEIVEQASDVELYNPVIIPAAAAGDSDGTP